MQQQRSAGAPPRVAIGLRAVAATAALRGGSTRYGGALQEGCLQSAPGSLIRQQRRGALSFRLRRSTAASAFGQ